MAKYSIHSRGFISLVNIAFSILYLFIFRKIYVDYLVVFMGYQGYQANYLTSDDIILCDIITIAPILFYKAKKMLSDFISIMVYIFVYVPAEVSLQYHFGCARMIGYMLAFLFAMILFFSASSNRISKHRYSTKIGVLKIEYVFYFSLLCGLILLFVYRNNLHFVSFADVYDLRIANSQVSSSGGAIAGFSQMWSQYLFAPLLIAVGIYRKDNKVILLGFLLSVLLYMATGLKSAIIIPFVLIAFYWFMNKYMSQDIVLFFPLFTITMGCVYISSLFFEGEIANMAYSIVFMRSIGIGAQLTPAYVSVFSSHPYTYYSHVNIIRIITGYYPFSDPSLGNAVWGEYMDNYDTNANANFLLTDGVAALGPIGVVFIACVFYFLLVILNKLSNNHNQTVLFTALISIIVCLTNTSMFTTLLSGGLFIAMVIMRYSSFEKPNNKFVPNYNKYKE